MFIVVYGGEVDCVVTNKDGKQNYIELKTSRLLQYARQIANFKQFKLIKWWAQSYLIGIPDIVCGFRDDNGIVHKLQNYKVHDIPKTCQVCCGVNLKLI